MGPNWTQCFRSVFQEKHSFQLEIIIKNNFHMWIAGKSVAFIVDSCPNKNTVSPVSNGLNKHIPYKRIKCSLCYTRIFFLFKHQFHCLKIVSRSSLATHHAPGEGRQMVLRRDVLVKKITGFQKSPRINHITTYIIVINPCNV